MSSLILSKRTSYWILAHTLHRIVQISIARGTYSAVYCRCHGDGDLRGLRLVIIYCIMYTLLSTLIVKLRNSLPIITSKWIFDPEIPAIVLFHIHVYRYTFQGYFVFNRRCYLKFECMFNSLIGHLADVDDIAS